MLYAPRETRSRYQQHNTESQLTHMESLHINASPSTKAADARHSRLANVISSASSASPAEIPSPHDSPLSQAVSSPDLEGADDDDQVLLDDHERQATVPPSPLTKRPPPSQVRPLNLPPPIQQSTAAVPSPTTGPNRLFEPGISATLVRNRQGVGRSTR